MILEKIMPLGLEENIVSIAASKKSAISST
jgi:hypothetical protein